MTAQPQARARRRAVPALFHVVAAAWIVAFLMYGERSPERYTLLLQEDRIVEWGTVWLFLAAAVAGLSHAIRHRRVFDGLVALFCLFVAGEEFSWGQRLFGYYPPEFFLSNNFQQELNLHNLPQWYLQPRWVLMVVLGCYGILLPLASLLSQPRALMARLGATSPPLVLVPWFTTAIVLLVWYPLTLTGEWVEALAGSLFLMSTLPPPMAGWITLALAVGFGAGMTEVGAALERGRDSDRIACATAETTSLVDDVATLGAGTVKLWEMRRVHKRVWSSITEEYLDAANLQGFNSTPCNGPAGASAQLRHQYGIDPWGSPYWLLVEIDDDEQRVSAYSFGPNRRRDLSAELVEKADIGDDILITRRPEP